MKDKNDKTIQADATAVKTPSTPKAIPRKKNSAKGAVVLTVIAAAIIAGGALWYVQQNQTTLSAQYGSQLQLLTQQADKNEKIASQALNMVQNQAQQIKLLTQELSVTHDQLKDIGLAVQTMSDSGSDLILLNDIEQLVTLAQQQLLIGGNLANAIVSLETAQARLAQSNRQRLAMLAQTINGDLDRLRAVQVADVSTVTAQLGRLSELLDQAPLYVPDAQNSSINGVVDSAVVVETPKNEVIANDTDQAWWQRTLNSASELTQKGWDTISQDLGQFISVRRVDDSAALLMSPEQADRFRDNLQLRITLAQLALMTKQPKIWHSEMAHIIEAIEKRFDPTVAMTQRALSLAAQLADTDIDKKLPTIDNTLAVIESLKQADTETVEETLLNDESISSIHTEAAIDVKPETKEPVMTNDEQLSSEVDSTQTQLQTTNTDENKAITSEVTPTTNDLTTQASLVTHLEVA